MGDSMSTTTFGDYIKQLRLGMDYSLRAFAKQVNLKPSVMSYIERDVLMPPVDLSSWFAVLGITNDSDEALKLNRLADEATFGVANSTCSCGQVMPMFLQEDVTPEQVQELNTYIQENY